MTPPRLDGKSSLGPICVEELASVSAAPEELVCSADTYSASPEPMVPSPSLRSLFHARYLQQKAASQNSTVVASAFSGQNVHNSSDIPVFAFTPLGFLFMLKGCANEGDTQGSSADTTPLPRPTENPPVQTGGDAGGLGTGIQTMFAATKCQHPNDLDIANAAKGLLMTCSDDGLAGVTDGVGLIEKLDASSGSVTALNLPSTFNGDSSKPVHLTSSAPGTGGIIYTGFAASGSKAEFEGGSRSFGSSGIFTSSEAGTGTGAITTFDSLQLKLPDGSILPISLAGINGNDTTVNSIQPNTPASMTTMGSRLIVVNANKALDKAGKADFAPFTIHRYTVDAGGALTPEAVGDAQTISKITGTDNPNNAFLVDGHYNPAAIAAIDNDRFAVVEQGLPMSKSADGGGLPGGNSSGIHVFKAADLQSGLNDGPDSAGSSFIAFTDAPDPKNPGVDFVANSSSQLSIIGNRYALIGSFDGSGRIAVVDCNATPPPVGTSRVQYIKIFEDGSDIASVVANPNGSFAYVISDTGKIRTVTVAQGADFGKVSAIETLASVPPGASFPAAFADSSVIAAHPGGYSKAKITQ
jgi:hypothetical protein